MRTAAKIRDHKWKWFWSRAWGAVFEKGQIDHQWGSSRALYRQMVSINLNTQNGLSYHMSM